jgi:hypothetical protein
MNPVFKDARRQAAQQPGVHREERHQEKRNVQMHEQRMENPHGIEKPPVPINGSREGWEG